MIVLTRGAVLRLVSTVPQVLFIIVVHKIAQHDNWVRHLCACFALLYTKFSYIYEIAYMSENVQKFMKIHTCTKHAYKYENVHSFLLLQIAL